MENNLQAKIESSQTYINTTIDISGFGYSKHGRSSTGITVWIAKAAQTLQDKRHNPLKFRKGGRNYARTLEYSKTGLRGEKNIIRMRHNRKWRQYKRIIAPLSQIHHEWIPGTPDYRGVALVEADQHMSGLVDVIDVLDGEITLFTELEVRGGAN